jgi:hypothetical protein
MKKSQWVRDTHTLTSTNARTYQMTKASQQVKGTHQLLSTEQGNNQQKPMNEGGSPTVRLRDDIVQVLGCTMQQG